MAITRKRGRGGACGEENRKFDCGSHGSSGDDRRRLRIICRNPGFTRPRRLEWEVCRSIAEKGEASTPGSFVVFREPPAERSNRVHELRPLCLPFFFSIVRLVKREHERNRRSRFLMSATVPFARSDQSVRRRSRSATSR